MHRTRPRRARRSACLPHTRGDAPRGLAVRIDPPPFTPHAWGCTARGGRGRVPRVVYPTRVGMHRERSSTYSCSSRLPHTRGDAPGLAPVRLGDAAFTPHAWGCTAAPCPAAGSRCVYPTRVGMHRRCRPGPGNLPSLPHTRGDAPYRGGKKRLAPRFTPHAWGCTGRGLARGVDPAVYPTRVGMHRSGSRPSGRRCGLPHTRGDAPTRSHGTGTASPFTPHAWGCTGAAALDGADLPVYPTRVGMHPWRSRFTTTTIRLPHTRGDAPIRANLSKAALGFTPHAWGCTGSDE